MEIVLPDGEVIHTGFGRYKASKVSKITRWGVGPHMDGLFSQSNLGIVTQMTFWLMARLLPILTIIFYATVVLETNGLLTCPPPWPPAN